MGEIGSIVLAAGASRRLGEPKQFLKHRGESLVRRATRAACEMGWSPVVVVAGEEQSRIVAELDTLDIHVLYHPEWERGIGSSLRAGLDHLLDLVPALEAVAVLVCDQPFVTAETLRALEGARVETGKPAAACVYGGTIGVPALFDQTLFARLRSIPDEQGAKSILAAIPDEIARVEFPEGLIDIDTAADRDANLKP